MKGRPGGAEQQVVVALEVDVLGQQDVGVARDLRRQDVAHDEQVELLDGLERLAPARASPA